MVVTPLYRARPCLPDFDGAVFRAGHHPFPLAVEGDTCDVACVALKNEVWCGVGVSDFEELNGVMACRRKISFVGGNAQSVHLRVGMLDRS